MANPHPPAREVRAAPAGSEPAIEVRCHCGCLVARRIGAGLELRCRRCKRLYVLRAVAVLESEPC